MKIGPRSNPWPAFIRWTLPSGDFARCAHQAMPAIRRRSLGLRPPPHGTPPSALRSALAATAPRLRGKPRRFGWRFATLHIQPPEPAFDWRSSVQSALLVRPPAQRMTTPAPARPAAWGPRVFRSGLRRLSPALRRRTRRRQKFSSLVSGIPQPLPLLV